MIVKPCWEWFVQRTAVAPTEHVTRIGLVLQLVPLLSTTGIEPTKVSWLNRASIGRPVEPRKTKPGSPKPLAFGAGTGLALQSS